MDPITDSFIPLNLKLGTLIDENTDRRSVLEIALDRGLRVSFASEPTDDRLELTVAAGGISASSFVSLPALFTSFSLSVVFFTCSWLFLRPKSLPFLPGLLNFSNGFRSRRPNGFELELFIALGFTGMVFI